MVTHAGVIDPALKDGASASFDLRKHLWVQATLLCFENVKNESLTMPNRKGHHPDLAPKCLMKILMCYQRLLTFYILVGFAITRLSRTHVKHILDIYEVYGLLRSCLNIKQYTTASTHNQCRIHCYYSRFNNLFQEETASTSPRESMGF